MNPRVTLRVLHEPCGQEHPYEQLAIERFPRAPLPGQEVSIGLATSPSGAAESVWVTWSVDAAVGTGRASGTRLEDDGQLSYWRVGLPAFLAGQSVEYRVHASGNCGTVSTDPFTFFVPEWREVGEVLCYRPTGDGLILECVAGDPALRSTLKLSFPRADQLRVQLAYGVPAEASPGRAGVGERKPPPGAACTLVEDSPAGITVATERLRLAIDRRHGRLDLSRAGGGLLLRQAEPATWLLGQDGRPSQLRLVFESPPSEAFYGFGERFNALNQRGNVLDVRVYDPYKDLRTRTYLPVPFFLSSQGYGLYVDSSRDVVFDLASTQPDRLSFSAELDGEGMLDFHVMEASDPKQIIAAYTDLTGKPHLPPIWAFGPWMSSNEWNSQARVLEEVAETIGHDIPATVLVIEAWSDEATFYVWNDACYSPGHPSEPFGYRDFTFPPEGRWPDPKGLVDELHRLGIRLLLWQIPVLKGMELPHPQCQADEEFALAQGYVVQEASGQPYRVRPPWFKGGLVLDITNPAAVEWWLRKRAYLLDELGVDGFKTDGGEHLWGKGLRFADGRRGDEVWNLYPNLYTGAYHEFATTKRNRDATIFSRAGFTGAQKHPCHWAGDADSSWEAFRSSIVAGLNAGMSGISYWGWDLGGFSGEIPTADLYLRAAAMAAFSPIMQYHSEYNEAREPRRDRTPWNIQRRTGDLQVIDTFRKYARLRMNLLPYIYSEAWKSSRSGIPMMRAMALEFPEDDVCSRDFLYQYLFGEYLLVAPIVVAERRSWQVYLPQGDWHDLWTGDSYIGPLIVDHPAPRDVIPVFVRAGACLPLNLGPRHELGEGVGNATDRYHYLTFLVYPRGQTSYEWYDGLSATICPLRCGAAPQPGRVRLELGPIEYDHTVAVRSGPPSAVRIDGQAVERCDDAVRWLGAPGQAWRFDPERRLCLVRLGPRAGPTVLELS